MKNINTKNKYSHIGGIILILAILTFALPTHAHAGNFFSDLWGDVSNGIGDVTQGVADFGGDVWKGTGQVLTQAGSFGGDVWNGTGQVLTQVGSFGGDVWKGTGQVLTQAGSFGGDVWNGTGQVLTAAGQFGGDVWNAAGQGATQFGQWGGDIIKGSGQVATQVGSFGGDLWKGTGQVATRFGSWGGDIVNAGSNVAGDVGNWFGGSGNNNGNNQLAAAYQPTQSNSSCSGTMTQSQYNSFKQSGQISSSVSISGSTGYGYFSNNTDCTMPVSLAAFKMFDNSLSTQQLFSSTGVSNLAPHSSLTLNVNLPNCKSQVDTYFGAAPSTPVGDGDINIAAAVTSGNYCTNNPPVNPPVNPATLSISCYANPSSVQVGNTINWYSNVSGGSGSYSYSWSGSDSLSGSGSSVSKSYSSIGGKSATVTVTSGTQSATANCNANVYQVQDYNYNYTGGWNYSYYPSNYNYGYNYNYSYNEALSGACSAGVSNTSVGSVVTWTATPQGGNGFYTYYWYGDEGLSSNGQYTTKSYSYGGTKNATVTITSNGQSITRTCAINVGQVLAYTETNPSFSSVYLSQVPYTGAGDILKVVLFAIALVLWSGLIAFTILKRKERQNQMAVVESTEKVVVNKHTESITEMRNEIVDDTKAISDVEDFARYHKIIISSDAAVQLVKLSKLGKAKASDIIRKIAESKEGGISEWTTLGEKDIEKFL